VYNGVGRRTNAEEAVKELSPRTLFPVHGLYLIDTDYRFEKGDEVYIDNSGRNTKVRIMDVRVHIKSGVMTREILALKL
jgi:hypothetical protein